MGFYLRKSIRIGPLRFNLSKSGIGVSTGIPGFRIGMGPRGNYIHAGRGGIYYRATIPSGPDGVSESRSSMQSQRAPTSAPPSSRGPSEEIESGPVAAMREETAGELLSELNEKRRRLRIAPIVAFVVVAALAAGWRAMSVPIRIACSIAAFVAIVVAHQADVLRKSTVIMYDLDAEATASYQRLIDSVCEIGKASSVWHVATQAEVHDAKYHAGANTVMGRELTSVAIRPPPLVKCNVDVAGINVGRQSLFFFPDRILVFDSGAVGAVAYSSLAVEQTRVRFIESGAVPADCRVVDRTWKYVNKKGGPDRRFRDNYELPICEYEGLHFRSGSGLNEFLHVSKVGAGDSLIRYLSVEGRRLAR